MRPTEILASEHRVIEQVLSCLEKMADRALCGSIHWADARTAVDFLHSFADECHHRKEEDFLFPKMESRGFSRAEGPTGVMLAEHEEGRQHIQGMSAAIGKAITDPAKARHEFLEHARAYVPLLRRHILKEEHRLFPMANRVLSAEDQAQLLSAFNDVENVDEHADVHVRCLREADELAESYDVPHDSTLLAKGTCCCSHSR